MPDFEDLSSIAKQALLGNVNTHKSPFTRIGDQFVLEYDEIRVTKVDRGFAIEFVYDGLVLSRKPVDNFSFDKIGDNISIKATDMKIYTKVNFSGV